MTLTSERYNCEIGRIHFKHPRRRESRKDKRDIAAAKKAMTAKLEVEVGRRDAEKRGRG